MISRMSRPIVPIKMALEKDHYFHLRWIHSGINYFDKHHILQKLEIEWQDVDDGVKARGYKDYAVATE